MLADHLVVDRCRSCSATLIMLRRAASIAFCTATGTSLALPLPMPTRPSPSPDHGQRGRSRAIRPPLTTLVTRLTAIIFSLQTVVVGLRSARGVETLPLS